MENDLALKALLAGKFIGVSWWGEYHSDLIVRYLNLILCKENNAKIVAAMHIILQQKISKKGKAELNEILRQLAAETWIDVEGKISTRAKFIDLFLSPCN